MEQKNKAVMYEMIGPYVVGTVTDWQANQPSLPQLNRIFNGAVDVIALRLADGTKVGVDAWLIDDALAQPRVGAYQISFGEEYFGMASYPKWEREWLC